MNMNQYKIIESVEAVKRFFDTGATKNIESRITALKSLRRAIIHYNDELLEALHNDLNKSHSESYLTEISIVLHEIDDHIRHIKRWAKRQRVSTPLTIMPARSCIISEPLGTVLIISPWNYPFQLLIAPLVGAIAAGNTAILKPSEYVSDVNCIINKIISDSFSIDYVTLIEGGHEENTTLLTQKFDYIFFTGSPAFGRVVMEAAAKYLTPITLELGGKSPCIVDSTAKIDIAARRVVWGKLLNAGQTCVAPDYLFVHKKIRKEFTQRLVYYIRKSFGDDPSKSKDFPRIVTTAAAERLVRAMHSSGNIIYGGEYDIAHRYIAPTLIFSPEEDSLLMRDEIFGPILPIFEYEHLDTVLKHINLRPKPLALYYFGDSGTAKRVLQETSSGGACVNDTIIHIANHNLPFGGVGNSGMGRYHSKASFDLFSNKRAVVYSSTLIDIQLRYAPYVDIKWLKRLMR